MTQLKLILMAILAIFARLLALPTSAARRGFSIMCSPLPTCRWLAVCLFGATLMLSGCGGTDWEEEQERIKENCGSLRSANTCEKAKDHHRCVLEIRHDLDFGGDVHVKNALVNIGIECFDEDDEKGKPFQQVCPEGAACNQGVQ